MRKRFYHDRVCSCSPCQGVTYLNARILRTIVNSGIHPVRCASTSARKAHRGLLLGDLCAEARHPVLALKVWKFTLSQIHEKDYNDWIGVWFNTEYVRLRDVISDGICEIIGRRIDDVERRLGLADAHGRDSWEYRAGDGWYDDFFGEKYDCDWSSERDAFIDMRNETAERRRAERLFCEARGEQPPQAKDFFDYWNDGGPAAQDDAPLRTDDWD